MYAIDLAGDDIKMLGGIQRHIHTSELAKLARPLSSAIDDDLAVHVALRGAHTHRTPVLDDHAGYFNIFDDPHAIVARAFRQRHRQISWIRFAVARNPDRALQIVGAHQWKEFARPLRRNLFDIDAKTFRQRYLLAQHFHALFGRRDVHATALFPTRRQPGFGLKV